jgi:hypothetical protein
MISCIYFSACINTAVYTRQIKGYYTAMFLLFAKIMSKNHDRCSRYALDCTTRTCRAPRATSYPFKHQIETVPPRLFQSIRGRWEFIETTATGISGHFSTTLTEVFPCFFLSCKEIPGYNSQRWGTARTSQFTSQFFFLIVMCAPSSVFCVLFVCKCVLYYCHRVSTQLS